jgi:hypothetical protein
MIYKIFLVISLAALLAGCPAPVKNLPDKLPTGPGTSVTETGGLNIRAGISLFNPATGALTLGGVPDMVVEAGGAAYTNYGQGAIKGGLLTITIGEPSMDYHMAPEEWFLPADFGPLTGSGGDLAICDFYFESVDNYGVLELYMNAPTITESVLGGFYIEEEKVDYLYSSGEGSIRGSKTVTEGGIRRTSSVDITLVEGWNAINAVTVWTDETTQTYTYKNVTPGPGAVWIYYYK